MRPIFIISRGPIQGRDHNPMMMMKVQRNNPKKKKPMASTNLTRSATRRSPSFFINIGLSQPKMRIQVPKLLARTMQRRSQDQSEAKKTLPKKVISILSNVFGSKKSKGSVPHSKSESGVGKEVEKMGWFKRRGKGSGKCVYCQHSLLKADDLTLREPHKVGVVPTISRQESTRKLARVSSRVSSRRRVRRARSVRKRVDKETEEEEDDEEEEREENNGDELCKKRILMGGKCKPVDFSESVDFRYFSGDRYWGYG